MVSTTKSLPRPGAIRSINPRIAGLPSAAATGRPGQSNQAKHPNENRRFQRNDSLLVIFIMEIVFSFAHHIEKRPPQNTFERMVCRQVRGTGNRPPTRKEIGVFHQPIHLVVLLTARAQFEKNFSFLSIGRAFRAIGSEAKWFCTHWSPR